MSIFGKPITAITFEDLNELLADGAVENVRLEFKREISGRDETLKKLSAFANTYGGYIVVGASAHSETGRIEALPGVEARSGYKQTVVQWCAEGATPFVDVEVSDPIPVADRSERVCYLLAVRESDLAPHFLNGRKGVWVRTNEFSSRFEAQLANERELHHLAAQRQIVRERRRSLIERARARFETLTEHRYQELGRTDRSIGSRFTLSIVPRFPSREICSHAELRTLLHEVRLPWRQVGFPRVGPGPISQHESEIVLRPGSNFSLLEANTWGLLFYATEIAGDENPRQIHINQFLGQVVVFLRHAREMIVRLGYGGPLVIEMTLEGIRGAEWVRFRRANSAYTEPGSELDDSVSFSFEATSADLHERIDGVARNLLQYVFFAMNLPLVAESEAALEEMIKAGYEYNYWTVPSALQL